MRALAKATFDRVFGTHVVLKEPEAAYAKPRPMTGFFATLTPEQKAKALAYKGSENYGDSSFKTPAPAA